MTRLPRGAETALGPVRDALHRQAEEGATRTVTEARQQAEQILAAARAEAGDILSTAEREGAEAARADAVASSARARREARRTVLAEQERLHSMLTEEVMQRARGIRHDPRYPQILRRLTAQADRLLGPMASVTESHLGGVVGTAGSRRLDLTLPALAEQALEDHAREVQTLWEDA